MNTIWNLQFIAVVARCLLVVMCISNALVSRTMADSVTEQLHVPAWMERHENMLPQISTQDLAKMKAALPDLALSDVLPTVANVPESYWTAARKVLELGEKASLALVWMYVEEPSQPVEVTEKFGREKESIIAAVKTDPVAAKWLVPIFRLRMEWVYKNLKSGTLDRSPFSSDELSGIEGFMIVHGTRTDLDNVRTLREDLRHSKAAIAENFWPLEGTSQERDNRDQARRASRRASLAPFYLQYKWCEEHLGPVKSAAPLAPNAEDSQNEQDKNGHSSMAKSSVQPAEVPQPERSSWLVWLLVVIAATVSAVWVFSRKSK